MHETDTTTDPSAEDYHVSPDIVSRTVGGETVLVNLETERYFSVNATGAVIWDELSKSGSAGQAVARLTAEFDIDAPTAHRDVDELVTALVAAGLLTSTA